MILLIKRSTLYLPTWIFWAFWDLDDEGFHKNPSKHNIQGHCSHALKSFLIVIGLLRSLYEKVSPNRQFYTGYIRKSSFHFPIQSNIANIEKSKFLEKPRTLLWDVSVFRVSTNYSYIFSYVINLKLRPFWNSPNRIPISVGIPLKIDLGLYAIVLPTQTGT